MKEGIIIFNPVITRFWGIAEATIEDLAFGARSSREADEVSRPSGEWR